MVGDILNFVEQIGIPITSALAVGWFLFIILKFILAQVETRIRGVAKSIGAMISMQMLQAITSGLMIIYMKNGMNFLMSVIGLLNLQHTG